MNDYAEKIVINPIDIYSIVKEILELARWAPSGDNTQVWRFEIADANNFIVYGFDTADECIYDLNGNPSLISHGALIENIVIAASKFGKRVEIQAKYRAKPGMHIYSISLHDDCNVMCDPLIEMIPLRSVQRRAMDTTPISNADVQALQDCLQEGYSIKWFTGLRLKLKFAGLLYRNAGIRLTMPEAYDVHRKIIEWGVRYSTDRVPDQALGVDPLTRKMMRWVMASWARVKFFNVWFAGTVVPRLEMDFVPSLACAAHFVICSDRVLTSDDDYVQAGRNLQRFWLKATALGYGMQPEMTPIIFHGYVREGRSISHLAEINTKTLELASEFSLLLGEDVLLHTFFMGRIGKSALPRSRSLRKPLSDLMMKAVI